jgi:hypothetical protein
MASNNPYVSPQDPIGHSGNLLLLRKVSSILLRVVVVLVSIPVSGFLLLDGIIFRNPAADPVTGKQYGCFTILEGMLGLEDKAGCLRPIELLVGVGLIPVMAFVCFRRFRSTRCSISNRKCEYEVSSREESADEIRVRVALVGGETSRI